MTIGEVILEGIVGSKAYGLDNEYSDTDIMRISIAPFKTILGLDKVKEQEHTLEPDIKDYELAKFCHLALKGNPAQLEFLFLDSYTKTSIAGQKLIDIRHSFLSRRVRHTYTGYLWNQLKCFKENGYFGIKTKNRTAKHGRHCMRLYIQGCHLLKTGELKVKLSVAERELCFLTEQMIEENKETFIEMMEDSLDKLHNIETKLPLEPDYNKVNNLVINLRKGNHYHFGD